jgi:hypothetical protein
MVQQEVRQAAAAEGVAGGRAPVVEQYAVRERFPAQVGAADQSRPVAAAGKPLPELKRQGGCGAEPEQVAPVDASAVQKPDQQRTRVSRSRLGLLEQIAAEMLAKGTEQNAPVDLVAAPRRQDQQGRTLSPAEERDPGSVKRNLLSHTRSPLISLTAGIRRCGSLYLFVYAELHNIFVW